MSAAAGWRPGESRGGKDGAPEYEENRAAGRRREIYIKKKKKRLKVKKKTKRKKKKPEKETDENREGRGRACARQSNGCC